MTRKSRREIERAVEDLGGDLDPQTVRGWVGACLRKSITEQGESETRFTVVDENGDVVESPDHSGEVCIYRSPTDFGPHFWIDAEDVPDWIDVEDLPVRL